MSSVSSQPLTGTRLRTAGLPESAPIGPAAQLSDELEVLLAPRMARLGYLGGFFAVGARQPDALAGFVRFTEALKASVPTDLTELVALRVSTHSNNPYERPQHVALARKQGRTPAWIDAVSGGWTESDLLTDQQQACLALVDAMLVGGGHHVRAELIRVVESCGDDLAVGVVLLVSRYVAHSYAAAAFELTDPTHSEEDSP